MSGSLPGECPRASIVLLSTFRPDRRHRTVRQGRTGACAAPFGSLCSSEQPARGHRGALPVDDDKVIEDPDGELEARAPSAQHHHDDLDPHDGEACHRPRRSILLDFKKIPEPSDGRFVLTASCRELPHIPKLPLNRGHLAEMRNWNQVPLRLPALEG